MILLSEVEEWFLGLAQQDDDQINAVTAAIDMLAANGPTSGPAARRSHQGIGETQHERTSAIEDDHPHPVHLRPGTKRSPPRSWRQGR
ncbi:hypothetical protein LP418_21675 [Nocardioides sp. B-3]|nr:hypothetical protein [Nocardioides sp. B-3]UUZ58698.1 hypothetical protein LP418_21675 [Nocardioides sp. B-3]